MYKITSFLLLVLVFLISCEDKKTTNVRKTRINKTNQSDSILKTQVKLTKEKIEWMTTNNQYDLSSFKFQLENLPLLDNKIVKNKVNQQIKVEVNLQDISINTKDIKVVKAAFMNLDVRSLCQSSEESSQPKINSISLYQVKKNSKSLITNKIQSDKIFDLTQFKDLILEITLESVSCANAEFSFVPWFSDSNQEPLTTLKCNKYENFKEVKDIFIYSNPKQLLILQGENNSYMPKNIILAKEKIYSLIEKDQMIEPISLDNESYFTSNEKVFRVGGSVMDNKNKQVIFEVMLDWVYGQDLSIMINDSENNPVLKNPGQWNSLKNCVQVIIDKKELNLKL